MTNPRQQRLASLVSREAMGWGDKAAAQYYSVADSHIDSQWRTTIWPILSGHKIDLSNTMDFACGRGRNAKKLREAGAGPITLVDVNPENIAFCEANLVPLGGYETFLNNGFDLAGILADQFTHVYSFDAMVHFDLELVVSYVAEFARVLKPLGTAFIHHSNFTARPGGSFRENPHWRNFMSDAIFRHISICNGFEIMEQRHIEWGGESIDCITVMRRSRAP